MEGIKSINSISGFSWADEVEKQEEEAKTQLNQQQKPNPFGSARPREVVLQEKGVDWRKLDQKLHESSNISYVYKKEKENIAAPTELTYRNHQPFPPRNNVLERNIGNPRNACDRNGVPFISQTLQNQNGALVPPLKYPPKNTMGLMNDQAQNRSYNSYGSEFIRSNFHDFNTYNSIRENGRRHFTGWELMHHQSAHKGRELHNVQSNERGTLYHEKLVVPPSFVNERGEGNSRDEFGRRNSVMERLGPFPNEASIPINGGSLNKHRGGMKSSTTVKEVGRREMEPEYGNQQFHADEFMGHSIGAMGDSARGRFPHIVDVEMVEYSGNCRKRAMISGFKNNQNQQRRRR